MTPALAVSSAALSSPSRPVALAGLALAQTALFLVPIVVLGQAIGWPASLRLPAAEALPLVGAHPLAVQIGYWAYLLVSLALVPFALVLRRHLAERGVAGPLVDTATVIGIVSGVLKTLGIVRWLVAMPMLADAHAAADPAARAMIEIAYVTLNAYAGAVGELLGVQLTGGIYLVLIGLATRRAGHTILGPAASVIGLLFLATATRTIVPDMAGAQALAVPLALSWFVAFAVATLAGHRRA